MRYGIAGPVRPPRRRSADLWIFFLPQQVEKNLNLM
jgi:hypothetical protein